MKFLLICLMLSTTISAFAQSRQQQRDRVAINTLIKSVHLLANADLSCGSDMDCLMVPVGSRACGGPSGFVLASKENDNLTEIELLAKSSELKEKIFNLNYEIMSSCEIIKPQQPICDSNVCGLPI